MVWPSYAQYLLFFIIILACVRPLGGYLFNVFNGGRTFLDPLLCPLERAAYRFSGVDPAAEMDWKDYALAFTIFGLLGTALLFLILMLQPLGPWFDAAHQNTPMTVDLAINTAISFATTTTWQAYGGETTMSYFSQIVGLAAQNFLAGAGGLAVGIAFIRGFARQKTSLLGNFWVDLTRAILWVLLPMSIVGALLLVWQGVPLNFDAYTQAVGIEGHAQTIAQGPVAALEAIKNIGTNGGGFFNVNGAHPYENPTPLANLLEMLMIVLLPAALTHTFGRMVGQPRQGWMLFWVMTGLFAAGVGVGAWAEQSANPAFAGLHVEQSASVSQPGGNMEGKEARFGVHGTVLAAVTTSNGATGSYNAMHDSFMPLGGMVPLTNMVLGEIIYGGLGTGIYAMVVTVLLAVFLGGLMVGRTPSFLGKDVNVREFRLVGFYIVAGPAVILLFSALAVVLPGGLAGLTTNSGAHGFTEIVYAYASAFANNGQNFAGLSANSPFYNATTAIAMIVGRFGLAALALALAGAFARQQTRPISPGHLATDSMLFASLLIGTIIIIGGLSYVPAMVLGPVADHIVLYAKVG